MAPDDEEPEPKAPSISEAALSQFDPTQVRCLADLIKSTTASFRDLIVNVQAAIEHLDLLSTTIDNALVVDEAELITSETPSYSSSTSPAPEAPDRIHISQVDGVMCDQCGGLMQRTGSCMTCSSCGHNDGCG